MVEEQHLQGAGRGDCCVDLQLTLSRRDTGSALPSLLVFQDKNLCMIYIFFYF